jgi:translation initiation factor 1
MNAGTAMLDNIVYSTAPGWKPPCPACGKSPCGCNSSSGKPKQTEPVRVFFRRGHKGSGITIIEKIQMHPAGKEELLKKFKKNLGVGGTVKLGALELQGDHRDTVETELKSLGYKVKRLL